MPARTHEIPVKIGRESSAIYSTKLPDPPKKRKPLQMRIEFNESAGFTVFFSVAALCMMGVIVAILYSPSSPPEPERLQHVIASCGTFPEQYTNDASNNRIVADKENFKLQVEAVQACRTQMIEKWSAKPSKVIP